MAGNRQVERMASVALTAIMREQARGGDRHDSGDDELPPPCRSAENLYRATVHNFRPGNGSILMAYLQVLTFTKKIGPIILSSRVEK